MPTPNPAQLLKAISYPSYDSGLHVFFITVSCAFNLV